MEIMLLENILQQDCGLSDRQRQASIFPNAVKPASRMLRAWLKKKTYDSWHMLSRWTPSQFMIHSCWRQYKVPRKSIWRCFSGFPQTSTPGTLGISIFAAEAFEMALCDSACCQSNLRTFFWFFFTISWLASSVGPCRSSTILHLCLHVCLWAYFIQSGAAAFLVLQGQYSLAPPWRRLWCAKSVPSGRPRCHPAGYWTIAASIAQIVGRCPPGMHRDSALENEIEFV